MNISGIQKLSLNDYPGLLSCVIFTQGCNFDCSYCHNSLLIPFKKGEISEEEVFEYLEKRRNTIDAVVISGGEPTLQKGLKEFIKKIKKLGFKIKLDTNGSYTDVVKELLKENLLDYIAMDIKHDKENYPYITGFQKWDYKSVEDGIKTLEESGIDYEFRTTIMKPFHTIKSIENICKIIKPTSKYYIQNFRQSESVRDQKLSGFSDEELLDIETKLKKEFPNLSVRGI